MNKAILMGRLTKNPELRQTPNGVSVVSFTLAVDRRFKSQNGERETDFIPMIAWRQQAEFIAKYFKQGSKMVAVGSIQVRSYDKNGERRYITEIVVDEVYFAESKVASFNNNYGGDTANKPQPAVSQASNKPQANDAFDLDDSDEFFNVSGSDNTLPFSL